MDNINITICKQQAEQVRGYGYKAPVLMTGTNGSSSLVPCAGYLYGKAVVGQPYQR